MTTDKLKQLLALCKCGVYLTVNQHRDYYVTVEQRLRELTDQDQAPEISEEVRSAMIANDTMVELQFYPSNPVGFYVLFHHDIDAALDEALSCLEGRQR